MLHRTHGHFSYRRRPGWRRYGGGVGLTLVLTIGLLMATGWGSAVADQVSQITKVFVTNDSAHPVPVQEQRTDANGNIKVHEQGTANANVTNDSANPVPVHEQGTADVHVTNDLNVGSPAPIIGGGGELVAQGNGQSVGFPDPSGTFPSGFRPITVTAIDIHMTSEIQDIRFTITRNIAPGFNVDEHPAGFIGPASGGSADVSLALDRPIKFDRIQCFSGDGSGQCALSWVGAFAP